MFNKTETNHRQKNETNKITLLNECMEMEFKKLFLFISIIKNFSLNFYHYFPNGPTLLRNLVTFKLLSIKKYLRMMSVSIFTLFHSYKSFQYKV